MNGSTRNYFVAVVSRRSNEVAVVLNAHHPILGFAKPPDTGTSVLIFQDDAELESAFKASGVYHVATAVELEQPPIEADLVELTSTERRQIAYWKPRRIGDVVFNWWD